MGFFFKKNRRKRKRKGLENVILIFLVMLKKKKFKEILEISLEVRMCIIYLNQCISHGLNLCFEFLYDCNFKFICP